MNVRQIRKRAKLNQTEFWARVGVRQSVGSRYEAGRRIPKPVAMLLDIAYGTRKESEAALKVVLPSGKGRRD